MTLRSLLIVTALLGEGEAGGLRGRKDMLGDPDVGGDYEAVDVDLFEKWVGKVYAFSDYSQTTKAILDRHLYGSPHYRK